MPSGLRIYLARGLDRVFHLLCGFLLPFWDCWEECLTLVIVVRRVCGGTLNKRQQPWPAQPWDGHSYPSILIWIC